VSYEPIDPAAVATERRADILAGRPMSPRLKCHYCGQGVGRGALWCSTICATDYTALRVSLARVPD